MKKRIGEILVDSGVIENTHVEEALSNKKEGQKIGDYLVGKGYVKEDILTEKLSQQLHVPYIRLEDLAFSTQVLEAIDSDVLKEVEAFPVEITGSLLSIAMADPMDEKGYEKLEASTDYELTVLITDKSKVLDYIDKYYGIDASMSNFIQIDDGDVDVNKAQAVTSFFNKVKEDGKVKGIIKKDRGMYTVKGDLGVEGKRDVGYVRDYFNGKSEKSELSVGSYKFEEVVEGDTVVVSVVVREGVQKEYWVVAEVIEEEDNLEKIDVKVSKGLNIFPYEDVEEKKRFVKTLEDVEGDKVVYGSSNDYRNKGFHVVDDKNENVEDLIDFGDVFIIDRPWMEGTEDSVLSLLNEDKIIIFTLPFPKEVAEKYVRENFKILGEIGSNNLV